MQRARGPFKVKRADTKGQSVGQKIQKNKKAKFGVERKGNGEAEEWLQF